MKDPTKNSIRVNIAAPGHWIDPSLLIRVGVLLENALKEEFAKNPTEYAAHNHVKFSVYDPSHAQMLETTRSIQSNENDLIDMRPMQVEIVIDA